MIESIKKVENAVHFNVKVTGIRLDEKSIQGVMICSDKEITARKGEGKDEIIIDLVDKDPFYDLTKNPNVIAVNANPALQITKNLLSRTQMKIKISPRNS